MCNSTNLVSEICSNIFPLPFSLRPLVPHCSRLLLLARVAEISILCPFSQMGLGAISIVRLTLPVRSSVYGQGEILFLSLTKGFSPWLSSQNKAPFLLHKRNKEIRGERRNEERLLWSKWARVEGRWGGAGIDKGTCVLRRSCLNGAWLSWKRGKSKRKYQVLGFCGQDCRKD